MEEEVKLQDQEQESSSSQELESTQDDQKQEQESIQAKNFRELRQSAQRLKRERDEALRLLEAQQRSKQALSEDNEDIALNPDDLVEGKHFSKVQKKMKDLERKIKDYESQSHELAIESKLKSSYHDFDKVVNADTINLLRDQYPELHATISSSGDLYNKAVTAYTLIKKLGLLPDTQVQEEQLLANKNLLKPRSLSSVSPQQGSSPLSRANAFANGLTEELKEQLRKEMSEARKGY